MSNILLGLGLGLGLVFLLITLKMFTFNRTQLKGIELYNTKRGKKAKRESKFRK